MACRRPSKSIRPYALSPVRITTPGRRAGAADADDDCDEKDGEVDGESDGAAADEPLDPTDPALGPASAVSAVSAVPALSSLPAQPPASRTSPPTRSPASAVRRTLRATCTRSRPMAPLLTTVLRQRRRCADRAAALESGRFQPTSCAPRTGHAAGPVCRVRGSTMERAPAPPGGEAAARQ